MDPALGSGFFLFTLLNEIIAAKSQLGVLADRDGNPLFRYKVVADDVKGLLVIDRKNFNPCTLTFADSESRRIQETLLHEKLTIIENCLYRIDIEPFSVSMGKLRLWADVLQHLCWDGDSIRSFPLIEGNLRCANSLVSRFSVQEDLKNAFQRIGYSVVDYKKWAIEYKTAKTKEEKNMSEQLLGLIKRKLLLDLTWDERTNKDLLKWQNELAALKVPSLFDLGELDMQFVKSKLIEVQSMVDKCKKR